MKDNTVKLSGYAKDRFIERFFAGEQALDGEVRSRLTGRAQSAFTSLRVRKAVLAQDRSASAKPKAARPVVAVTVAPKPVAAEAPAQPEAPPAPTAEVDAYAVKLVPVFQREGRDGLLARLAGIDSVEHLRQMAKAQQIVLPQPLRSGDAAADALRSAIADAVAKRVADRRAAAG